MEQTLDARMTALSRFYSAVFSSYLKAASSLCLDPVNVPGTDLKYQVGYSAQGLAVCLILFFHSRLTEKTELRQDCKADLWRSRMRDAIETVWIYVIAHAQDCVWEDVCDILRTRHGFADQVVESVLPCHYFVNRNAKMLSRIVHTNIEYSEVSCFL